MIQMGAMVSWHFAEFSFVSFFCHARSRDSRARYRFVFGALLCEAEINV